MQMKEAELIGIAEQLRRNSFTNEELYQEILRGDHPILSSQSPEDIYYKLLISKLDDLGMLDEELDTIEDFTEGFTITDGRDITLWSNEECRKYG
jgi:hypothetical protein